MRFWGFPFLWVCPAALGEDGVCYADWVIFFSSPSLFFFTVHLLFYYSFPLNSPACIFFILRPPLNPPPPVAAASPLPPAHPGQGRPFRMMRKDDSTIGKNPIPSRACPMPGLAMGRDRGMWAAGCPSEAAGLGEGGRGGRELCGLLAEHPGFRLGAGPSL